MSDEWCVERPGDPVKLDVGTQGDPFIHHLTDYLARAYPGLGALEIRGGRGGTLVSLRDERLRSLLRLVASDNTVAVSVVGTGERVGQVEPWFEAVEWARRNCRRTEEYQWWAVISADAEWHYTPVLELAGEARIGETRLIPTDIYTEAGTSIFVHSRRPEKPVQLIVASGFVRSHNQLSALEAATARLRVVCGLLALVSGSPWTLRSMPSVVGKDFDPGDVDLRGWGLVRDDVAREHDGMASQHVVLPQAMSRAAANMRRMPWLSHLVSAYQEALELAMRHESFAVIGFVSIVEELGNRRAGRLPRCGECAAITGSGDRFKVSLQRVMAPDLADVLGNFAYDLRSRTAHSGRLHGREASFGLFSPSGHLGNSKSAIFPTLLYQMHLAAGQLLRLELGLDTEVAVA
jgi:hypothetical protein